ADVEPLKRRVYLAASLLTAAAVAVSGVIGFVGLVVPHAMRALWGHQHRPLLPAAFLGGGTLLALSDTVARTFVAPRELPVGVVAQREENPFPQRVRETVLLGRFAHLSLWGGERPEDHEAVSRALERCDVVPLADRWLWTLSGGEYQRVRLARALAQEPRLLVLDEPTASLDIRHEMELFELVRALADRHGLAVVLITHHVNLAARFADQVLLLAEGRAVARGSPAAVLTAETVRRVFGWPVAIAPFEGAPQMIPLRSGKDGV